MHLYEVISEELWTSGSWDGLDPPEPYRIFNWVVAETRAKAIYAVWKNDRDFTPIMQDMPKFSCKLIAKDVDLPAGICTVEQVAAYIPGI